ncbi:hypothetical protein NDU88_002047 [Pleurodeles waltl]|uniref:Uncharacterized protein n=1 Tax=Pleurodeles waltl TaxID=8319 RepID=A0AAV7R8Z5_PLEWA|nr:hypothetical protein NDU88_002047 [Pleurodeles waltl]
MSTLSMMASGKPTRQLLSTEGFSESKSSGPQEITVDLILKEILVVHWLEAMDAKMTFLTTETKSIHSELAGLYHKVESLNLHLSSQELRVKLIPYRYLELYVPCDKIVDLEDRSSRGNARFFGVP